MNEALPALAQVFAAQHGVAADRQIRAAGVSWKRQQHLIDIVLWRRIAPGVVALAGSASTWKQRAMAATLAPGARPVLHGAAAARLHGMDGFARYEGISVVVPHNARIRCGEDVTARRSRTVGDVDRHVIDAIPVTTIPVTLIHLHAEGLGAAQALDGVLRDGVAVRWLRETFERWNTPRVPGAAAMLRLLDERVAHRLPRSWFQRLAQAALHRAGVTLVEEWPVRDARGRLLAELDLADVAHKVGIESQSWEWHGSPSAQRRDLDRKRRLRQLGWEIVDVWWSDLERIDDVLADLFVVVARASANSTA